MATSRLSNVATITVCVASIYHASSLRHIALLNSVHISVVILALPEKQIKLFFAFIVGIVGIVDYDIWRAGFKEYIRGGAS